MSRCSRGWPLLLAVCAASVASAPAAAAELGRLFTTPEQRALIDRMRAEPGAAAEPAPAAEAAPEPAVREAAAPSLALDGLVRRSKGRATVWVNGQAIAFPGPGRASVAGIEQIAPPGEAGVRITTSAGRAVELMPGQRYLPRADRVRDTLDGNSGE